MKPALDTIGDHCLLPVCRDFYRPIGWHNNDALIDLQVATAQYEEALLWCQEQYSATSGTADLLQEFSHVLFHNNAPYHSKRNLRLMCESMYGKLTREQHEELYERYVAQGVGISEQNATTYTCPVYASLLSFIVVLGEELIGKLLLCFSYGSGCAASMYGIHVQQLPKYPKTVFEELSSREVKSVHETLHLVQAYEDAYRSFPFQSAHTEHRLPESYYLEQVGGLGVRRYTKPDSESAVGKQELGVGVVQIELLQQTLDSRLLADVVANLHPAACHVLVQAEICHTELLKASSMPIISEFQDHSQLQWNHGHTPMVAVYQGTVQHVLMSDLADITIATEETRFTLTDVTQFQNQHLLHDSSLDSISARSTGLLDIVSSAATVELLMNHWQDQALSILTPEVVLLATRVPLAPAANQNAAVELGWPVDGVAQLRLDTNQTDGLDQLQAAIIAVLCCPDLSAIVLCGEMQGYQIVSNAAIFSSASLSMLGVPLLGVWSGLVHASAANIELACDWRICTQEIAFNSSWISSFSSCLASDNLQVLGLVCLTSTHPGVAIDNAMELACSMQQAPPLGLQHCLQLTRATCPDLLKVQSVSAGDVSCASNSAQSQLQLELSSAQHMTAVESLKASRPPAFTEPTWNQHKSMLQTRLFGVETLHMNVATCVSRCGELVQPNLCCLLGAVDEMLVTLSTADGLALLELNDARHYNAVSHSLTYL